METLSEGAMTTRMIEEPMQDEQITDGVHGLRWRRGAMIGSGGFGSVYLAISKEWRRSPFPPLMAVKSADFSVSTSLRKERKLLSYLHGSPYIVKCFGDEITTGENGGKVYNLLLEYASGGSLLDLNKKFGGNGLPETEVRRYARSILRGIKHVHDRGCVHLDIKPANILLFAHSSGKFTAKLCDFGMARAIKPKKRSRNMWGTAMYLSPEAVVLGKQDASADIWAIGCVLLEMLTGKRVWDRKDHWSTDDFILKIGYNFGTPEIPIWVSEEGKEFLNGCLVRRAEDRLTADMLLKLPFISQLGEDDDDGDEEIDTGSLDSQAVGPVVSLSEIEGYEDESDSDQPEEDPSKPPKEEEDDGGVAEFEALNESDNQLSICKTDNDCDIEPNYSEEEDSSDPSYYTTYLYTVV
ncbi:hypothetical protein U1Q18_018340 [Sarracenia purpurea var. burkii]